MKICELKIQKEFYDMIEKGEKLFEVRKLNKKYIESKDIIRFIDIYTKEELGYFAINYRVFTKPYKILEIEMIDSKTKEFIKENYINEDDLILFNLKKVEVIYV